MNSDVMKLVPSWTTVPPSVPLSRLQIMLAQKSGFIYSRQMYSKYVLAQEFILKGLRFLYLSPDGYLCYAAWCCVWTVIERYPVVFIIMHLLLRKPYLNRASKEKTIINRLCHCQRNLRNCWFFFQPSFSRSVNTSHLHIRNFWKLFEFFKYSICSLCLQFTYQWITQIYVTLFMYKTLTMILLDLSTFSPYTWSLPFDLSTDRQ